MPLRRKKTFVVFREAGKLGPYDERPMLPDDVHLQICLSRNDRPQPFFLICEKDTLLAVFSGIGKVEFRGTNVAWFPLAPGDHVYVPAGAPTRLVPDTESVIMRYKAREPGLEGVAWYCEGCNAELYRHVFDTRVTYPQAGYLAGTAAFNAHEDRRRCGRCQTIHPNVDVSGYRWEELLADLRDSNP
jgi:3-hydroxyanthranilate 3,4-dioxygenase